MNMRMKIEQLTPRDIKYLKRDIEILKLRKKTFLTLGIVLSILFAIGLAGTILLGFAVYNELKGGDTTSAYFLFILFDSLVGSLTGLCLVGAVAMFVLRGTLLNKKIDKRQRIIDDYDDFHQNNQQ